MRLQPRSPKGSKRGGQWAPKPTADTITDGVGLSLHSAPAPLGKAPDSISVTRALGSMDQGAIHNWKMRTAIEWALDNAEEWRSLDRDEAYKLIRNAPNTLSLKAAQLGTQVHTVVESLGGEPDMSEVSKEVLPYASAASDFLRDRLQEEWIGQTVTAYVAEAEIASHEHGYHGRADLMVETRGENGDTQWHIVDWKSTANPEAKGPYANTALQLSAYAHADSYRRSTRDSWKEMPEITSTWAVSLLPDGRYIADETHRQEHWDGFCAARAMSKWQGQTKEYGSHANHRATGGTFADMGLADAGGENQ